MFDYVKALPHRKPLQVTGNILIMSYEITFKECLIPTKSMYSIFVQSWYCKIFLNTINHYTYFPVETCRLPSNRGQTFLQQVIPPSLVNCPRAVSRKKTGIPQANRKMRYGMKKAPEINAHKLKERIQNSP